jgi:enoyl-CoA hydratase/carnithine racemase
MSPSDAVTLTREDGTAVIRMQGRHGNAINPDLLRGLAAAFGAAETDKRIQAVLLASGGKLFSPGLDLQELLPLDRPAMAAFMDQFCATLAALYTFPKPVLAAVSGHAVAGGAVLAMTADMRILKQGVRIGLNEVKVGVPLPYGVAQLLRETVHRPALTEIALLGRNYSDQEAVAVGFASEVVNEDGFDAACRQRLAEFAEKDASALALTKRYLRQPAADRVRHQEVPRRDQFLDCWFSPATRGRIQEIVAQLTARG